MKIQIEVDIYETDGVEHKGLDRPKLTIRNCGDHGTFIHLEVDGKKHTVGTKDLRKAVEKAS